MTVATHQASNRADSKLASGFFDSAPTVRAPKLATQSLGTHQENAVFYWGVTSGCVVAPNSGGMARDPAELAAQQAQMQAFAPFLKLGEAVSRWNPGLPTIKPTYDAGAVGITAGASMNLGPVQLDAGFAAGTWATQKGNAPAEWLWGGNINGGVSVAGASWSSKLGADFGIDQKFNYVDHVYYPKLSDFDYRGFSPADLTLSGALKTPVGKFGLEIDFSPLFNTNPPPASSDGRRP